MNTCKDCRFWKQKGLNYRFGECLNPETFSWVRGQSFEPPEDFGCVNFVLRMNIFGHKVKLDDNVNGWKFENEQ